jgi:hypothetical protein
MGAHATSVTNSKKRKLDLKGIIFLTFIYENEFPINIVLFHKVTSLIFLILPITPIIDKKIKAESYPNDVKNTVKLKPYKHYRMEFIQTI